MGPVTISYEDFKNLVSSRTGRYFEAVKCLVSHGNTAGVLTRPLLGELLSQATQIEELLDSYGARNNCIWAHFRSLTAAIKTFSNVSYELLHIQHSIPAYRLLAVKQDFAKDTEQTLRFTKSILNKAAKGLLKEADTLKLSTPVQSENTLFLEEKLPTGRLPHDLARRKIEAVSKTVSMLATAFLNLAAESRKVLPNQQTERKADLCDIAGPISEEKLRSLELRFHNLQSLYDTYVSTTETEVFDNDLPVLRGHISVVLHLLRTARDLSHYYERHVRPVSHSGESVTQRLVKPEQLLEVLLNYCISFVCQYLTCAELLCQDMLKRYTEVGKVEVQVPQYRGFHVRPSTLISKLVLHYGSEVKMKLGEETYDAGSPLELFRANEKINAHKRRSLAQEIVCQDMISHFTEVKEKNPSVIIRDIIMSLAEQGKVIIYEHPFQIESKEFQADAKIMEQITDEIAKLQVTGKIDIGTDLFAVFVGDKRVLSDIKLLAENGYGEDNFGNNITLPERLTYLRQ